jgi:two-component system, NtrC family, sensor kinase
MVANWLKTRPVSSGNSPFASFPRFGLRIRLMFVMVVSFLIAGIAANLIYVFGLPFLGLPGYLKIETESMRQWVTTSSRVKSEHLTRWMLNRIEDAQRSVSVAASSSDLDHLVRTMASMGSEGRPAPGVFPSLIASEVAQFRYFLSVSIFSVGSGALVTTTDPLRLEERMAFLPAASYPRYSIEKRGTKMVFVVLIERETVSGLPVLFSFIADLEPALADYFYDSLDSVLNLDTYLLDADMNLLFFASGNRARSGTDILPIQARDRTRLRSSRDGITIGNGRGGTLVVSYTDFLVEPVEGFGILVSAEEETALGRLNFNAFTIFGAMTAAIAIGICFAAFGLRKGLIPLEELRTTIDDFSNGRCVDSRPKYTTGEIGAISRAVFSMIAKIDGWKRELELEVLTRTKELLARNAIVRGMLSDSDQEAFGIAIGEIAKVTGAERGVILYYDGERRSHCAYFPASDADSPGASGVTKSESGDDGLADWALSENGKSYRYRLLRKIEEAGMASGYISIARMDADFDEAAKALFIAVTDGITPIISSRFSQSRQEFIRRLAEKALEKSERRLRTLFEESKDMIYTVNADDVFVEINAAGLHLLDCRNRFEAIGHGFADFVMNPEDRATFLDRMGKNGFVSDYEIVLKKTNGSFIYCLDTAQAVYDSTGKIIEIQGIVKDISERIRNEQELWKANLDLAESNLRLKKTQSLLIQQEKMASIGLLSAGIAHEINNPLGFLKSNYSSLVKFLQATQAAWQEVEAREGMDLAPTKAKYDLDYAFSEFPELIKESDDGFQRIMEIVKNLRNFARTGTENFGAYNLNAGLESTITVAWNEIKYVADLEKDLGTIPQIEANGNEINQVILNILVNAAQAIKGQKRSEKGKIGVRTLDEGESVVCEISDDGPGIPEEIQYRIFDPFFTTKEPGEGTGLGLSISYDIVVNKHRGALTVDSSPHHGTRFSIRLPVKHAETKSPSDEPE